MSYSCPRCGITSHNPHDERHKYCAQCHLFENGPPPPEDETPEPPIDVRVELKEPMPIEQELEHYRELAAKRGHDLATVSRQLDKALHAGREIWDNRAAIIRAAGLGEAVSLGQDAITAAAAASEHHKALNEQVHTLTEMIGRVTVAATGLEQLGARFLQALKNQALWQARQHKELPPHPFNENVGGIFFRITRNERSELVAEPVKDEPS